MSRDELVAKGRSLGVERPELMTRVELGDEIVRRTQSDPSSQRSARGWLGIARDLVASVVESGLNLPDAAAVIRGDRAELETKVPAPVATVTLAEIYATQGHVDRALSMLDEVLEREPEHPAASALRERLREQPVKRASVPRTVVTEAEDVTQVAEPVSPEPVSPEPVSPEPVSPEPVSPEPPAVEAPVSVEPVQAAEVPVEVAAPAEASPSVPEAAPAPALGLALLVLRTPRAHPLVCWELPTLEVPAQGVRFELECLGFSVVNARPERREVTLQIDTLRGSAELTQFDARTVVRAALGYRASGIFVPVAIGTELLLRGDAIDVSFRPPLTPSDGLTSAERALVQSFAV
jgi:hypothetical protein